MSSPDHFVSVDRVINAPADDLYTAWTDPEVMQEWMGAAVEADVRVGGGYRIEAPGEDGAVYVHMGEYRLLEPGRRIVQTFRAGPIEGLDEPIPFTDEFIDIRFEPLGPAQTLLRFLNGWNGEAMSEQAEEAVKAGWSGWLDQLESLF
jgi:uncharacterized protein YndB with AHSA1/START domain